MIIYHLPWGEKKIVKKPWSSWTCPIRSILEPMWKRETKFKVDQHSKRKDSVSFNNWTQGFPSIITSNKKLYFFTKMLDYLLKKEKKERRLWRNSHYHTNTHRDTSTEGIIQQHKKNTNLTRRCFIESNMFHTVL